MAKNQRNVPGERVQDLGSIANVEHNPASGARKVAEIGPHLIPLKIITGGVLAYTCDASTKRVLDKQGASLAIYNSTGTVGSVTLGEDNTLVSLAPGITDANGHVGIPCMPNAWTKISCGTQQWVITSASTLMVFLVDDHSSIKAEIANVFAGS